MSMKCLFRNDDGSYCKRWAQKNSNFCHAHRLPNFNSPESARPWPGLHPFTRLATPTDLFDLLRESLNAARMGTMPPGQASSIATLSYAWLKAYDRLRSHDRIEAMDNLILPTLADATCAAQAERLAAATDETERAAGLIAELDHVATHGPDSTSDATTEPDPQPQRRHAAAADSAAQDAA